MPLTHSPLNSAFPILNFDSQTKARFRLTCHCWAAVTSHRGLKTNDAEGSWKKVLKEFYRKLQFILSLLESERKSSSNIWILSRFVTKWFWNTDLSSFDLSYLKSYRYVKRSAKRFSKRTFWQRFSCWCWVFLINIR